MTEKVTQELIEERMARAKTVACSPGGDRCSPFPDRPEDVRAGCSAQRAPEGRCRIGATRRVILANAGRESWDVWLDVHTGEGRLRRRTP